ncbi:MAG: TatD family deoxyribonuclease [Acidobacteria bacterium]|nr:TatD family deoxyribonuclease [Acidobacteriota bacterium]
MMLVDSHCHLDGHKFDADRDEVIQRAIDAGVTRMLTIGTGDGPPDLDVAIRLAEKYPCIWASAGVHPHDAEKWTDDCAPILRDRMKHPRVVALGEIGLDYHYDFSPRDQQRRVFIEQLQIAREATKPIVIHTREAWDDTFAILKEHWQGPGVMHCFSGGPAEAEQSLAIGFAISYSGIVTYPKAPEIREAALLTPLGRMLVETDAPYLAPVPHRGKRNEPAYVAKTAAYMAELLRVPYEQLCNQTSKNFDALFGAAVVS